MVSARWGSLAKNSNRIVNIEKTAGPKCNTSTPRCLANERRLALRELEAAAGFHAAVLLALHHAAVAGEEAALLEDAAQLGLVIRERLGNAVANRAGLAGQPAARDGRTDVELAQAVGGGERLLQKHLQDGTGKVLLETLVVDDDLAGAGLDPDARDGVLALAGRVGAAVLVKLLNVDGSRRGGGITTRLQRAEIFKGLGFQCHGG